MYPITIAKKIMWSIIHGVSGTHSGSNVFMSIGPASNLFSVIISASQACCALNRSGAHNKVKAL